MRFSLFFCALFCLGLLGCSEGKNNNENDSSDSYELEIRMHDAPVKIEGVDIEKVVIEITGIEAHHETKGWITLSAEKQKLNLLELQNGVSAVIFKKPLDFGTYSQIRLILNENNELFVKRRPYRLNVPSGEQTGVKLVTPFTIAKGKMVEIMLDFDVEKSVIYNKGQGFQLKPTIKIDHITEHFGVDVVKKESWGNVYSLDKSVNIRIQPNSLSKSQIITINDIDASLLPKPGKDVYLGKVLDFGPDGLNFVYPASLYLYFNPKELEQKGSVDNIHLRRFNEITRKWEELPATIIGYANFVYARIDHFSIYTLSVTPTCDDQVKNGNETGVDCGGSCPAQCINCNGYDFGNAYMADAYSFNDPAVIQAANEALTEYAQYKGVSVSELNTPEKKMEAVGYYVSRNMAWMQDESGWDGMQTPRKTILYSGNRYGSDGKENNYCRKFETAGGNYARFCGDCEDHSILRSSLLRHLGVSEKCILSVDYHDTWRHSASIVRPNSVDTTSDFVDEVSGQPEPYNYNTAENLFVDSSGKKGGHSFNIIRYYNKWRILDYNNFDTYFVPTVFSLEHHRVDNVWSDHFGIWWHVNFLNKNPPENYIHNYPGPNKCYEGSRNYWTHDTLYKTVCP